MKYKDCNAIVNDFVRGDRQAVSHLFTQFHGALCYFAENMIDDREEAKDIVITTFTKLWNRRENFDTYNNIKAFLYITTRNACLDYLRFKQRKIKFQQSFVRDITPDEEVNVEVLRIESELLRKIWQEIENLPERYRKVFELTYLEGRKAREVAEIMNLTVTNVTTLRSRGLQLLKIALSDKEWLILIAALTSPVFWMDLAPMPIDLC